MRRVILSITTRLLVGSILIAFLDGTQEKAFGQGIRDRKSNSSEIQTIGDTLIQNGRRPALNQWWTTTPHYDIDLGTTKVGKGPQLTQSDGADIWIANQVSATVSRIRASDGKLLETWTGAFNAIAPLIAMGRVFVVGGLSPGALYIIDPRQAAGDVTSATSSLGNIPTGIAFDGSSIWTANFSGSVSIVTPQQGSPWSVRTVSTGFINPFGILYDGMNIWITDLSAGTLLELDSSGSILQSIKVGSQPRYPVFDGANIWVPNSLSDTVTVVRASTGEILATLRGNGLNGPTAAAFDGQRIIVTSPNANAVSLWRAADMAPIGSFSTGASSQPRGVCSDGLNFWITLTGTNNRPGRLARF